MSRTPTGPELTDLADALELELCTDRLLARLFPGETSPRERPGRYAALEGAIASNPGLRDTLLSDDATAEAEWRRHVDASAEDIELHHTLAVLYRERALARLARTGADAGSLTGATVLWVLLLSTEAFWERFDAGTDESVLRAGLARELLDLHAERGARALTAGDTAVARDHLACLHACRSGAEVPRTMVGDLLRIPYWHLVDDDRLGEIAGVATELLDAWCSDVIDGADRLTRERIPEGQSANYEAGIDRLKPFIGLGVAFPRALATGLEWHNEWCYVDFRAERARAAEILRSARDFADGLEPHCVKGDGRVPENRALSEHYVLRAVVSGDPAEDARCLDIALEWNPDNDIAAARAAQLRERRR
ncbi:MAG: hypothetical protein ACRDNL_29050 [Spirillospora sp.]